MTRIDARSSGLVTIDESDAEINEGLCFFYSDFNQVSASGTLTYTLLVGSKNIDFLFSISSAQFGFYYLTHEGVTANEDGIVITPRNHFREDADNSTVVLRLNPTGLNTAGAIQLRKGYDGTALNPAKGSGGSASLDRKVILKRNTKYSLVVINLSTSVINDIMVTMGWDEL